MCDSVDVKSLGGFGEPCIEGHKTKDVHEYRCCNGDCSPRVARDSLTLGVMNLDQVP